MPRVSLARLLYVVLLVSSLLLAGFYHTLVHAVQTDIEPVQACVLTRDTPATDAVRANFARCLGWQADPAVPLCRGNYLAADIAPLEADEIHLNADEVSFYHDGRSTLSGNVEVRETNRVVNAQTAYVYRNAKSGQVTRIELLGEVKYLEPDRLMIARKVTLDPRDKSGRAEDVLYRFKMQRYGAILPAWGRASLIQRFANKDYLMKRATYTTCAPQDRAWQIEADKLVLDNANSKAIARNATLFLGKTPILHVPYFSFPTSKKRKSGFLFPSPGYSNVGGADIAFPYYWNIAPNYDATITPHIYTRRGFMLGGEYRYLTEKSKGFVYGEFLPQDRAYRDFLRNNVAQYPQLAGKSSDRWAVKFQDITKFTPRLNLRFNFQQVSDDYYLQDFGTNLATLTERQLLREAQLFYNLDNWVFSGKMQSYQTLRPINETPVSDVYQRLPQLMAQGIYDDLPFNANFTVLGQYDNFQWPNHSKKKIEGPRYYLNPALYFPQVKPWGYFTPGVELVQNHYEVRDYPGKHQFSNSIPRYSVDSGLYFDRTASLSGWSFTQTLEPRLYYLYVPFQNQAAVPVYDSAYMIFSSDQLFRTNRFSGFDRIGDTNQLSYALTSRWLSNETGAERASITVGQSRYFSRRRVQLCQTRMDTNCFDTPFTLGFLSSVENYSPVASRAIYRFNPSWMMLGDYVWDPATRSTNNGNLNLLYQPAENHIIRFGYTYLVNGDITRVANTSAQNNALHQASFAYAWPFTEKWSSLGAVNYNLSKGYGMMAFLGLQYDNCCWATRLVAGRSFQSLNNQALPQYSNNIYFQVMLKGLGSAGRSAADSMVTTWLPGYVDRFHS